MALVMDMAKRKEETAPAKRGRGRPKIGTTKQTTSIRLSEAAREMSEKLSDKIGVNRSSIIEMAIREKFRREFEGVN